MKTLILAAALLFQGPPPKTLPPTQTISGTTDIPLHEVPGTAGAWFFPSTDALPALAGKTVLSADLWIEVVHNPQPGAENLSLRNPALALMETQSAGFARIGYPNWEESDTDVYHSFSAALTTFDGQIDYAGSSGTRLNYTDTGGPTGWVPVPEGTVPTDGTAWTFPAWLQFQGVGGGVSGGNISWNPLVRHGAVIQWRITYR